MRGLAEVRQGLGDPAPPTELWQNPFDYDSGHLDRLARLRPDERADPVDLIDYALDMHYEEVQKDLLLWVLPFCLRAWRDDLRREDTQYGGFVEHFYPALVDGGILTGVLNATETAVVATFMRDAILEEIDDQRGLAFSGMGARPYRWVRAITTYGVVLPDIERIWTAWWLLGTYGRAVAAVQYISCLAYGETENPVFAAWTHEGGGGPPCLWEFEGHLYSHRWLEPNVQFLRQILDAAKVTQVLHDAVSRLARESEGVAAARVLCGVAEREAIVTRRCEELPRILAQATQSAALHEWSL